MLEMERFAAEVLLNEGAVPVGVQPVSAVVSIATPNQIRSSFQPRGISSLRASPGLTFVDFGQVLLRERPLLRLETGPWGHPSLQTLVRRPGLENSDFSNGPNP